MSEIITDAYKNNRILTEDARKSLIYEIVDFFLNKGILKKYPEIESIAKEICSVFRTEEIVSVFDYYLNAIFNSIFLRKFILLLDLEIQLLAVDWSTATTTD